MVQVLKFKQKKRRNYANYRKENVDVYIHFSICLHGAVLSSAQGKENIE
jgi:uncharacterized Fe-S cluster protein YjdI